MSRGEGDPRTSELDRKRIPNPEVESELRHVDGGFWVEVLSLLLKSNL